MNIDSYLTFEEIEEKLRQVQLKGFEKAFAYKETNISIQKLDVNIIVPCQNYVLTSTVQKIIDIHHTLLSEGKNPFHLMGGVVFDSYDEKIPFLPPLVEVQEIDGNTMLILCDGMHRMFAARKLGYRHVNVLVVEGCKYPYYSYPIEGGWDKVVELDELPENFAKKRYVLEPTEEDPSRYKQLFRNLNGVFEGIQKPRHSKSLT